MQKFLDKHKGISLSDKDVLKLVEGKAKILIYSDLKKYDTLDKALGKHGAIFLLYEFKKDYGHWCAVFKHDDKTVEFFDSYGTFLDDELEEIPEHFREISGQMYPTLTYLMYHSPYDITYNEHRFQELKSGINTCGRWSALRIAFRDLTLEEFARLFKTPVKINGIKGKLNPDDVVSILTTPDLDY